MKNAAWEKCHYFGSGRCPEQSTIDKVYLIPQLLELSEIEAATEICKQCEHYHEEKRKYRRVSRPFRVLISNKDPNKSIEGTIVDVSINGALIKLDNWLSFDKDETVNLQLRINDKVENKVKSDIINLCGRVQRITREKQELAIVFMKDTSVKKCANI
jgi:hypothetical protein